ncbi:hypothetical protein OAL03_05555 [Akkermansiaceae bacterium]|nr:hypothetical protein [Akkermansiaceae bacterium]
MKNIISSILVAVGLSSCVTDHTGLPIGFFWQEGFTFVNGNGMNALQLSKSTSHISTDDREVQRVGLQISVAQQQGYAIGFGATRAGALGDAGKSLPKGAIRLKVSYTKEGKKWKCTIKYKPKK